MTGEHVASSTPGVVGVGDLPDPSTAAATATAENDGQAILGTVEHFIPKTPAEAAKAIGHIAVVLVSAIIAASSGGVSLTEGISIALLVVGLIPVYIVSGTYSKMIAAGVIAALQVIATFATNWGDLAHITGSDWLLVVLAVLNALGVGVIPNSEWTGAENKK